MSATVASTEQDGAAERRLSRLRAGVQGLGRGRGLSLDRVLLITGSVLLPLGVILIIVGWYGASHTPWLFEQIPYAVSGGVLGGSLVIAGGFLYFGYWLTRIVQESRRQTEVLTSLVQQLQAGGALGGNGAAAAIAGPSGLVATANGTMAHRPDCPVVFGKDDLRRVPANAKGFQPCKICDPFGSE